MNINIQSTVASFEIEGIKISKAALEYCKLRDEGKISCKDEVAKLKKKYIKLAKA